ncbi:MAG: response regulator [Dehalococcoidia bacterium]
MPRFLVVDDDPDVRELVELALDGQGYDVTSVSGGQAALEQLTWGPYDLIVCDLHMPGVDGPAVYRAVQMPRTAVLFFSGYYDASPYEGSLRETRAPALGKPFDINTLRQMGRRLLEERA